MSSFLFRCLTAPQQLAAGLFGSVGLELLLQVWSGGQQNLHLQNLRPQPRQNQPISKITRQWICTLKFEKLAAVEGS